MKMKTTRICKRKGCNNEFKLYKSTDKYCSPSCAYSDQKERPKKEPKPIKKVSDKRKRESHLYSKKRKTFLDKPENKFCPVAMALFEGKIESKGYINSDDVFKNQGYIPTDQVHHKAGRRGKFLNYVPYWLAVSDAGHKWIHAHPEKAYELGFLIRNTEVNI